jgi:SAM-dependent methyltransferase
VSEPTAAPDEDLAGAAVAAQVRAFYERHPYPLPVSDLTGYGPAWDDERRRAETFLIWPDEPYLEDRSILIAGCGTSQAAKYALRWPKARVTGIDFSKSSIDETARLKRKHNIHNLELHQLPVEGAAELGRQFQLVVCTGVLHHLADPLTGLQALRNALAPGGGMHLMLYAPYGRAGIYMMQDYCRRLAIGNSLAEIRDLAAALANLPADHSLAPLIRNVPDLRNEAGLADALLNPRDRAYSVPQLMDLLAASDLKFGRWLRQAQYLPSCGALLLSPHRERLMQLPPPEQFAALELFRGTMAVHSFIAYASDDAHDLAIDFAADDWLDCVPIRIPDTVEVQEQLPPSAAAVLINRNHTYLDIYLPIDVEQKRLFDSIDAVRTVRQLTTDHELARTLFERLWQYDHVVFDASKGN